MKTIIITNLKINNWVCLFLACSFWICFFCQNTTSKNDNIVPDQSDASDSGGQDYCQSPALIEGVRGVVLSASNDCNSPISGSIVYLKTDEYDCSRVTNTSGSGEFFFTGVADGSYLILARNESGHFMGYTENYITVAQGQALFQKIPLKYSCTNFEAICCK